MRKLLLYLDTSVISFALSEDIPIEDRNITLKLIEEINKGNLDVIYKYFAENFTRYAHDSTTMDREGYRKFC